IEEAPDGGIGVDAPAVVLVKLRADRIAVVDGAVRRAGEDAQAGLLPAARVLHIEVAVERAVVAGEESDAVPPPPPREAAQPTDLRLRDEYEARPLHDVRRD